MALAVGSGGRGVYGLLIDSHDRVTSLTGFQSAVTRLRRASETTEAERSPSPTEIRVRAQKIGGPNDIGCIK